MRARLAGAGAVMFAVAIVVLPGCAKQPASIPVATAPSGVKNPSAPTNAAPTNRQADMSAARGQGTSTPAARGSAPARDSSGRPALSEFAAVADLRDVHFDFDKSEIRAADTGVLNANATWLKAHPTYLVLVEGHTDERGTDSYNLALGERRAKTVVDFLVSQGVTAARVTQISYGEEHPLCPDKNEGCWSKNRRAHFLVRAR